MPNSILILDNAVVHHSAEFVAMVEATGCQVLYLSPYSPDFSVIEFCFHQVKEHLRRNREMAVEDLHAALWAALSSVTPENMQGYFRNCGYPLPKPDDDVDEDTEVVMQVVLKATYG